MVQAKRDRYSAKRPLSMFIWLRRVLNLVKREKERVTLSHMLLLERKARTLVRRLQCICRWLMLEHSSLKKEKERANQKQVKKDINLEKNLDCKYI